MKRSSFIRPFWNFFFGLIILVFVQRISAQPQVRFDASGNLSLLNASAAAAAPTVQGPASRLVKPGGAASFSTAASGSDLGFRWFFNNALVPAAATDTLLVTNASALNVGNYFVVVSNSVGSVTSVVARLELDSDRDGLGDAWELANFGSLTNQNGAMDWDGDLTPNRIEFQDGTNPTNRHSLLPRVTLHAFGGTVLLSPDKPAYQSNDVVTLTPLPDPGLSFIGWVGDVTGTTNPAILRLTGNAVVQALFGLPLATALNTTNPVTMGGLGGWIGQTNVSADGDASVATGLPWAGNGDAFLETTIVTRRDGTAAFDWKIDGERGNRLRLSVNGVLAFPETRTLAAVAGWDTKIVFLPAGTNRLRWTYSRQGGGWEESEFAEKPLDRAYVDRLVVTEFDNHLVDSDGNGLPDLWQYRYFDLLGNNPNADPDADGVTTANELADGTDPNNFSSVKPRLTFVIEGQGTAVAAPALASYVRDQYVTNSATPDPGWKFMAWVAPFGSFPVLSLETNNPSIDYMRRSKTFKAIFGLPPGLAADAPALTWTTSSNFPWYGQTLLTKDGTNAAQSSVGGTLQNSSDSWLETSVTGPGTLSFFWKASSATNSDYLTLLVNSNEVIPRISGITDWRPVVVTLPAGSQTLRWQFHRFRGFNTNAQNSAWLDMVKFTPGASAPEFISLPSGLLAIATSNLTFNVAARGTPVVSYQVFHSGVAVTPVTTNTQITVTNVSAALSGNWIVRAQNASGFTDSPAIPVSILPLPANDSFANRILLPGATPSYSGYSFGSSRENSEPFHSDYSARASVWHRWTAVTTGPVKVTAIATNPPSNLLLAAYTGNSIGGLSEVASDDAFPVESNGVRIATVEIVWRAIAGTTYAIVVDADKGGAFYGLSFENVPPPVNDNFSDRLPLSGSFVTVSGDNSTASAEPGEPPVFGIPGFPQFSINASNTLWWTWTAPASGRLRIIDQSSGGSPNVSIFTGDSLGNLVRLFDPFAGTQLGDVVKGVTYAISVDSQIGEPGGEFRFLLAMDILSLDLVPAQGTEAGSIQLRGPPFTSFVVQFSPNLQDWYFWSSNQVSATGLANISLRPPQFLDPSYDPEIYGNVLISIPPANTRFFRVVVP